MHLGSYISSSQVEKITPAKNGAVTINWKDATKTENIKPRRLFPLTGKNIHINFLDTRDEEIFILDTMKSLDKESKKALSEALNRYYVIPKIKRILDIREDFGIYVWVVETDKGHTEFELRQPSVDVKMLSKTYVVVKDINDNSYEITNIQKLDKNSQRLLEEQL